MTHFQVAVTAPDYCYLNQAFSIDLNTVYVVVVFKQSLDSWSHMWNLSNVSGCGSTSLFLVLVQGLTKVSDQSRALEDRNDSNNSLEVYTPSFFIHLFYNSPYMDVVDMHNILIIPSDSCVGLNPLLRTIQGNDPGTTACPLCAG